MLAETEAWVSSLAMPELPLVAAHQRGSENSNDADGQDCLLPVKIFVAFASKAAVDGKG